MPTAPDSTCYTSSPTLIDPQEATRLAQLAKALADPVRLRVYQHIAAAGCSTVCACHLPEVFGVAQPTLSHHLKKLVEAGLIHKEMRGRWAHFSARSEGITPLTAFLSDPGTYPSTAHPDAKPIP